MWLSSVGSKWVREYSSILGQRIEIQVKQYVNVKHGLNIIPYIYYVYSVGTNILRADGFRIFEKLS